MAVTRERSRLAVAAVTAAAKRARRSCEAKGLLKRSAARCSPVLCSAVQSAQVVNKRPGASLPQLLRR
jgi:hypothetical protein